MKNIKIIISILLYTAIIFSIDTDGDGYSDQLELNMGTDPNNKENRYYYGYWPFNIDKEAIDGANIPVDCSSSEIKNISCECMADIDCINNNCQKSIRGGSYCTPQPGDTFPHFIAVDQYGESVDIYDFSMQGKIIVLEFGSAWCAPCQQLSSWLSSGDNSVTRNQWWKKEYQIIREKVNKGEIIFITILFQDQLKDNASYDTVINWHEKYPNDKIPILADEYADIHQWIKPTGYPCVNLLDENMRLINFTGRGLTQAFNILSGLEPVPKAN
jgi:thiol-disulfide isomerase/thioredoxin